MPEHERIESGDEHLNAVLELLISAGSLTKQALERGRRAALTGGERLDLVLNKLGLVSDDALAEVWAKQLNLTIADESDYPEEAVLSDALGYEFLARAQLMPLRIDGNVLTLAVVDPLDRFSPAAVAAKTGLSVDCRVARSGEFTNALARLYGNSIKNVLEDPFKEGAPLTDDIERLKDLASDAPVIRIVSSLIDRAIESRASDLHLVATRNGSRVRYRVDGALIDGDPLPSSLHAAIVSRLKIMAGLDIAERRLPQDGRIRIPWRGREIDLRAATIPHIDGEGLVLRVLDRSAVSLDFDGLGLLPSVQSALLQVLSEPHGLFLVSGPTGSGKTMSDRSATSGTAERGFVLVSVLLVLGTIASLLVMLQSTSRSIAVGIEAEIRMRQGQHLADAGLVRIMAALENPSDGMFTRLREGRESVFWEFDGTDIALSLIPESGKIDLNAGDPDLIGNATEQVTGDRARAQEIYQYVLDRRAKRIAFSNPLEILFPRERLSPLADTVREMFTVLTRARGIDPLRASDAVLKTIPGITQRDLKLLEGSRRELSLYRHMQQIGHLIAAFSPERPIYTLRAAVIGPKGRRIIREAVVLLQHEESPIMVIAWGNVISPALPID